MAVQEVIHLPKLPPRAAASHKGDFGRVLVVAGSTGMSGAAILCGSAALRGGAGLVRVATAEAVWPIVAAGNPCYTTAVLPDDPPRLQRVLSDLIAECDVVAAGPGLGQSGRGPAVGYLLDIGQVPLVLDADGLNALADKPALMHDRKVKAAAGQVRPFIFTPHPGEFARLLGVDSRAVQANRRDLAVRYAAEHKVILVLKGHRTIVTDGQRLFENRTGNPSMATGGTGDVLTGLIAALLGQRLQPFEAAQLGVHLHGLAADLARDDVGEVSLIATDLLDYLPHAFRQL